jgi:hypothetical protein
LLQLKGKCQDSFFKEIDKYFVCKPIPKATAGNVFSSKLDKVPVGIGNGFFLGANRKSSN